MTPRRLIVTLFVLGFFLGVAPDPASAEGALEVYTYGNGHIMEKIFNAVAMFSNTSANSLLKLTALAAILLFIWNIMVGDGRPHTHFIHFIVIAILYLGMFIPKVTVTILDQTRAPGAALPYTATIQNVPAGLGYLASFTSRLGKRTTEVMEQAFSDPGYLSYAQYGLAIGPRLVTSTPNYPTREMSNTHRYLMECFYPMLQNGWGGKSPEGLTQSQDLMLYIAPSTEVMNLPVQYQASGGSLQTLTCNETYVNVKMDMQTWLGNQGPQDMAARMQLVDKSQLLSILGPAYFAYTGMNVSSQEVIQQRVMFQAFRQAMTSGNSGANNELMGTFALEANKYALEQSTIQITAQMFKAYLPIFRSVYQAILFGLFPIVLAMAFLNTGYSKIIGMYCRHMIWIELWDPVFAIHNYVSYLYQSSALTNQFTNAGISFFTLESSTMLDQAASFNYAVVLLTAPVAVSFAYFLASATESIGEGVLSGVASRVSAAAGVGGGEVLAGRGVYSGPAGSLTDQRLGSAHQYSLNDRGELEVHRGAEGTPGMRTPVNSTSVGHDTHQSPSGGITETFRGGGPAVQNVRMADENRMLGVTIGGDRFSADQSVSRSSSSGRHGGVDVSAQTGAQVNRQVSVGEQTNVGERASHGMAHQHRSATSKDMSTGLSLQEGASLREGAATREAISTQLQHALDDVFRTQSEMGAGLSPSLTGGLAAASRTRSPSNTGAASQPSPAGSAPMGPTAPSLGAAGATAVTGHAPSGPDSQSNPSWVRQAMMDAVPTIAATLAGMAAGAASGGTAAIPAAMAARVATGRAVQVAASQLMPRIMSMAQTVANNPAARAAFGQKALAGVVSAAAAIGPKLQAGTSASHGNSQSVGLSDAHMRAFEQGMSRDESISTTLSRGLTVSGSQGQSSSEDFSAGQDAGIQRSTGDSASRVDSTSESMSGRAGHDYAATSATGFSLAMRQDLGRQIFGEMMASGHGLQAQQAMQKIQGFQRTGEMGQLAEYLATLPSPTAQSVAREMQEGQTQAREHRGLAAGAPATSASPLTATDGSPGGTTQAAAKIQADTERLSEQAGAIHSQAGARTQDFTAHAKEAPRSVESLEKDARLSDRFQEHRTDIKDAFREAKPQADQDRAALWKSGKSEMSTTLARDVIDRFAPSMAPPAHQVTPTPDSSVHRAGDLQSLRDRIESTPSPADHPDRRPASHTHAGSGPAHATGASRPETAPGGARSLETADAHPASPGRHDSPSHGSLSGPSSSTSGPTPSFSRSSPTPSSEYAPTAPNDERGSISTEPQTSAGRSATGAQSAAASALHSSSSPSPSGPATSHRTTTDTGPEEAVAMDRPGEQARSTAPLGVSDREEAARALAAMDHRGHGHDGRPHPGTEHLATADGAAHPADVAAPRSPIAGNGTTRTSETSDGQEGLVGFELGGPVTQEESGEVGGTRQEDGAAHSHARYAAATVS